VFSAESALLAHEGARRREENIIRREARLDLARQGLVGTETEIAKWKAVHLRDKSPSSNDVDRNSETARE